MSNVTTGSSGSKIDTFSRTEGADTVHMQAVVPVDPESGSPLDTTNWILRTLSRVFGRFSFTTSSSLRVAVDGGTVSTLTTMSTGYVAFGDSSKAATLIMMSRSAASHQYSRLTQV